MDFDRGTVVVVDIESTCWEKNRVPQGQRSEIVEIGICTLDLETRQPDNKRSIMITPIESKMGAFCEDLTSISQARLDEKGIPFADACAQIERDYGTQTRLWCSWGNYDRRMFTDQCRRRVVSYPFNERHCNLKSVYQEFYGKRVGMKRALDVLGLDLIGTHHRGDDDAWNIARIAAHLLEKQGDAWLQPYLE